MAQVVIVVADALLSRVHSAFAAQYGWSATLADGAPNPETKAAHAKRRVAEFVQSVVKNQEASALAEAARASAAAKAAADFGGNVA